MSVDTLINRYRPAQLSQLVGHNEIVRALERALQQNTPPHGYLFSGPPGVGKTTTARIIASMLEAEVIEIPAAVHSGIDDTRGLAELATHRSLRGSGRRMIILDEAHALGSKKAWDPLLKVLEEPPEHLFMALCTTDPSKVPDAIKTRCYEVPLRKIGRNDIEALIEVVCDIEKWPIKNDVFGLVVQAADGSARKALSVLEAVHDAESLEEAERIVSVQEGSSSVGELCKALLSGNQNWAQIQGMLAKIDTEDFEQAFNGVGRYMTTVMTKEKQEDTARRAWCILDALTAPCESYDRRAVFFAAIGRIVWG